MGERSFLEFKCRKSFAYLEVLMQTLVIVVVATEVSREYLNEGVYGTRIDPRARAGFTKALLGIWQGQDVWTDVIMPAGVSSILYPASWPSEAKSRDLATAGSLAVTIGTALLYLALFTFIYSNRNWNPARFDVPDLATKTLQDYTNKIIWHVLALQGYFTIVFMMNHFGWLETPVFSTLILTLVWCHVFYICLHLSGNGLQMAMSGKHWDLFKTSAQVSRSCIVSAVLGTLWILWLCVHKILLFVMVMLLAAIPLVPVLLWSGIIRLTVILCGTQAAFPTQVALTTLLIMYAIGRLAGLWMTGSNVEWTTILIVLARCKRIDPDRPFWFEPTKIKLPENFQYHRKRATMLFLDCMAICVVACPLWAAYVIGTNMENHPTQSAFLVRSLFGDRMMPIILTPIISKISYWSNITCSTDVCVKCKEFESMPGESIMGTVAMAVSGVLAHATLITLVLALFIVLMFSVASGVKNLRSTVEVEKKRQQENELTDSNKSAWVARLYDCHRAMALIPQYTVKVILPVYSLEMILPESVFIPGLTVWLVGSGICFYGRLLFEVIEFACKKCHESKATPKDSESQGKDPQITNEERQITHEERIKLTSIALI